MSMETKDLSLFEQMAGTYTEKDGLLYPNLSMEQEPVNPASTMEMWKLREQAKQTAEEEVYETVIYRFY